MPESSEILGQVFSCQFCGISKNTFLTEQLRATASKKICLAFSSFLLPNCYTLWRSELEAFIPTWYCERVRRHQNKAFEPAWALSMRFRIVINFTNLLLESAWTSSKCKRRLVTETLKVTLKQIWNINVYDFVFYKNVLFVLFYDFNWRHSLRQTLYLPLLLKSLL